MQSTQMLPLKDFPLIGPLTLVKLLNLFSFQFCIYEMECLDDFQFAWL